MSFAVTSLSSKVWKNADGLHVPFDAAHATPYVVGAVTNLNDDTQSVIINLDYTRINAFQSSTGNGYVWYGDPPIPAFPVGALILELKYHPEITWAGTGAALDIGTARKDGTEIDANGLVTNASLTNLNDQSGAGVQTTAVGAQVPTDDSTSNNSPFTSTTGPGYLIVSNIGSANFTAGRGRLIVRYRVARSFAGGLYTS